MGICQTTLTKWSHQATPSGSPSFASVFQPGGINTGHRGYIQTGASLPPRPRLESPLGPLPSDSGPTPKNSLHTDANWMIWYPRSLTQTLPYGSFHKRIMWGLAQWSLGILINSKIPGVIDTCFTFQNPFYFQNTGPRYHNIRTNATQNTPITTARYAHKFTGKPYNSSRPRIIHHSFTYILESHILKA